MESQILIADAIQLDANPAAHSHIGWLEERPGRGFYECRLKTRWYGQPYGDTTIVVVIVGEHNKDLVLHKEGWLTVRESLSRFRECGTNAAHALQLFFTH